MRFTAEHRGHEFKEEWSVVDEDVGPVGCVCVTGITKDVAVAIADCMNTMMTVISNGENNECRT